MTIRFIFIFWRYTDYRFIYDKQAILKASKQYKLKGLYKWESLIGLIDLYVLSKCNFVVATHSSNFGRLVYEFMHIDDPNPFNRFKSLDKNYFIHGYKSILVWFLICKIWNVFASLFENRYYLFKWNWIVYTLLNETEFVSVLTAAIVCAPWVQL